MKQILQFITLLFFLFFLLQCVQCRNLCENFFFDNSFRHRSCFVCELKKKKNLYEEIHFRERSVQFSFFALHNIYLM